MSGLFAVLFLMMSYIYHTRNRYVNFSVDSILPYTYSEFHLLVSPSHKVFLQLFTDYSALSMCNQPALFSTVHCCFLPLDFLIVQQEKTQCRLYVWPLKAPFLQDPRVASSCLCSFLWLHFMLPDSTELTSKSSSLRGHLLPALSIQNQGWRSSLLAIPTSSGDQCSMEAVNCSLFVGETWYLEGRESGRVCTAMWNYRWHCGNNMP